MIRKWTPIVLLNGLLAFLFVALFKFVIRSYSTAEFILWTEEYSKKFVLYLFIFFIAFLLTSRWQLKAYDYLKEQKPWILSVLNLLIVFIISFSLAAVINLYFQYSQILHNKELTLQWIETKQSVFFAGLLFLFFLYILIYAIIGNIYLSTALTTVVLALMGYAHYSKMSLRVEPLYPNDFKQFSHLDEVIPMVVGTFSPIYIFVFLMLIFGIWASVKFLPAIKIPKVWRVILAISSAILVFTFANFQDNFWKSYMEKSDVVISTWNPINTYNDNGFIIGFLSNFKTVTVEKPKGYSKEKVLEIAKRYTESPNTKDVPDNQRPNVVFLMNEAFWDPTRLGKAEFSEDPVKNYRELMTQYPSGNILSAAFGGATANIEFEALTGFNTTFLTAGIIPYQEIVDNKSFIPTIVSSLEVKGYKSLAIHPYNKAFYKRSRVYETFGIDKFLDMETMKNNETSGPMISDESVSNEIADHIVNSKEPMFIHAVTMQNHLPYNPGRYEENTVKISGLTEESTSPLEVYTEGVKQADEALRHLIERVEELEEPTIIVFWGDHLPVLGASRSVYKESGFADAKNEEEYERKFSETPLLIYSTSDPGNKDLGTISPAYLGPFVFDLGNLDAPPFYDFLKEVQSEIPAFKHAVKIGKDQEILKELNEKQKSLLNDYQMIQYDLLVGKQYSKSLLFN
ncbi:LTA synthase family protein [Mesobacillus boroniphilus]|uniref:LTA synthase family protein n=1 Tax=Mesobacillus boroniphilus TaxID=308892 RepID=A0A944CMX3_9BACI|nr:LTA synthase family protein [Mesobacillus boroniphilus]MBS8265752.1 LTA synthase family protein [Mesobacillus boroniphilus]